MSDQVKLAREWAERVPFDYVSDGLRAAVEIVLANTDPQTMENIEWDAKEHALQGATDNSGDEFVMLDMQCEDEFSGPELFVWNGYDVTRDDPCYYTPNGKRYEIREITGPEHPEFLASIEEYRDAPDGSVAAADGYVPFIKSGNMWSVPSAVSRYTHVEMADNNRRRVLRWGIGGDA